jgi:O-antigen/teichoic acid export membrane protein
MRRLLWLSWPLGLTVTLGSLHTYVPRYFVERFHGEAALGIYGAFAYIVTAGQMVIAALGAAASPRLARYYAEGDLRRFFELVGRMAMLCGATGLAMVGLSLVAGRPLLEWLFAPEYAAHLETFTWLMAAGGLNYVGAFLGYATTATRRFHSLAIPYSASALLMVLLSALLVPAYGIRGAAWVAMGFSLSNLSIALALLRQAARKRSEELEVGRGPTLSGCETADEVS